MTWGGVKKGSFQSPYYTPDTVTLTVPKGVVRTRSGHVSSGVTGNSDYTILKDKTYPALLYIATSRTFSTNVTPEEFGNGDVNDSLIALIYTGKNGAPDADSFMPGAVVAVNRKHYTGKDALYRVATGNPYQDIGIGHLEVRLIPLQD